MSNKIRADIFEVEPKIGDIIVFNPPRYKGLLFGICIGFEKSGLPKVTDIKPYVPFNVEYNIDKNGYCTPKTGFVVKPQSNE